MDTNQTDDDIRSHLDALKPEMVAEALDAEYAETVRTSAPRAVYEDIPAVKDGWEIGPDEDRPTFSEKMQLAWCLRRGAEHERELEALNYVAGKDREAVLASVKPQLDAIDDWLSDQSAGEIREMEWFRERLENWAIADRLTHLDESKLTKLPSGSVSTTRRKQQISVVDAEEFYNWWLVVVQGLDPDEFPASESDDGVVKWKPSISVKAVRAMEGLQIVGEDVSQVVHTETGEVVPGLGVSEEEIIPKVSWSA